MTSCQSNSGSFVSWAVLTLHEKNQMFPRLFELSLSQRSMKGEVYVYKEAFICIY